MHKRHRDWDLPHRSTVCDILSRHGMVPKKRSRRRIGHPGKPTSSILAPNDLWSADFKGQFKTGNGRYLLGCQGLNSTAVQEAKPVFTQLFREYGLPKRIRNRQRRAVCHQHLGATLEALGLVGTPRSPARIDRARQTTAKRSP